MKEITNPFESLHNTIVFDAKDWGADKRSAWIYGIVVGWEDNEDMFRGFNEKFGWDSDTWNRLQKLHKEYLRHKEASEK